MQRQQIKFNSKIFLVLTGILFSILSFGQDVKLPTFIKDSLDLYISRALVEWQIPGVAVCIVKDGQVVWNKGYGVTETGTNNRVDEQTLFLIGSNTKAFTATALAVLDAEGKLSLNDRVGKYIRTFRLKDPLASKEVIIKDILSHRIGLETFQGDFVNWSSNLSRQEVIANLAIYDAPYSFRSKWGYCNACFTTAGEIIPVVSGISWEDFIRNRFFTPLEMKRSVPLSVEYSKMTNTSCAHTIYKGKLIKIPIPDIDNLAAAASIGSSADDMSHWVKMLLNNGKYNEMEIVPLKALNNTRFPTSIRGNGRHSFNRNSFRLYGLGWDLEDYEARRIVSHTGGVDGFVTSVCLIPSENLGIVVLTNSDQNAFYQACKWEIIDAFLGLPYRNYSKVMLINSKKGMDEEAEWLKVMQDSVDMKLKPELEMTEYTGVYKNEAYGPVNVSIEKGSLTINMTRHPGMTAKLEPIGGNRFLCTYSNPTFGIKDIYFSTESGKAKSMTLKCADFVDFQPYLFEKL